MHGNCLIPILVNPLSGPEEVGLPCRSLHQRYVDIIPMTDVTREDALRKMRSLALINIDESNRMEEGKPARLKNLVQ